MTTNIWNPAATGNGQVDRVEQLTFEPIKGYPMLHWHGKRPFTSTQYYPAQHKETYGPEVNGWRNKIYWGDNLQVMSYLLKAYRGKVQLVYIDPPFDSKAEYKKNITLRGNTATNDLTVFEEKQYTDIWSNDEYLQFMYERLILVRELLSDTGSVFLHCDWHKGHFLRCILEEIFGPSNFVNEIIWQRTSAGKSSTKNLPKNTDTIYWYSKTDRFTYHNITVPLSPETIASFNKDDNDGRGPYNTQPIISPNRRENLIYVYVSKQGKKYMPPSNGWRFNKERMKELEDDNRLVFSDVGIREKNYLKDRMIKGKQVSNLWADISGNTLGYSSEFVNYPTQKPEALLERVIRSSSNHNDLVFDCFMGSGTTQAAAMKLGRRFIGADINLGAVQITTKRLIAIGQELSAPRHTTRDLQASFNIDVDDNGDGSINPITFHTGFEVYNVNNYEIFRNPVEAKDLLLQALEVNRLQAGSLFDGEKDVRMVKIMPINRIATRQDLNELITGFDYHAFDRRRATSPNQPVEKITLVCMGHEPDLAAHLQREVPYKLDVEVVDILRDKQDLQFKRDAEAKITVQNGQLVIEKFYPMNLLGKLSMEAQKVDDWRELVESVMIDWNYDGAVLQPTVIDIPEEDALVKGRYPVPADAGTIRVKITDLLSESLEQEVRYG